MSAKKTLALKLLIDRKANKVLFGEANKDLVDFLFSVMSLPVGTMITLVSKQNMVGCLGELYGSIEKLNETYIQPNINKDSTLQTKSVQVPLLIPNVPTTTSTTTTTAKKYYTCSVCQNYVTDVKWGRCPCPTGTFNKDLTFYKDPAATNEAAVKTSTSNGTGYVHGVATYMVMDDLVVVPMSTISSIELLNQFNVHDVRALEQKVVNLGMEEGLMMLKASLESKTILTNVFIVPNKKAKVNNNKKKSLTLNLVWALLSIKKKYLVWVFLLVIILVGKWEEWHQVSEGVAAWETVKWALSKGFDQFVLESNAQGIIIF